jgi:hypothetical protein
MSAERMHSPAGIARYCSLLTPRARKDKNGQPTGDPKFQITLIFDDPSVLKAMKKSAMAVGVEKFGAKFPDLVKKGKANWPFGKNTDKEDDDGNRIPGFEEDDGEYVGFKTKDKPGVVDADAEPIMDKSEVYDGMTARVSCRAFAYDNESKGVAFYLINVQKLDDGDRLSGDPSAEDDFKPAKGKKAKKSKDADEDDLLS